MSDDKLSRENGEKGIKETDKNYYEELYTDLPKEVVNILMQTHPLMGKNEDEEATAYRSRHRSRPQREDVEEVREARMQQVGNEINEISNAPQQEGDPTRFASRRSKTADAGADMAQEDYEDGIQYVSVMPRKKSKLVEEVTMQTTAPPSGRRKKKPAHPFENMGRDRGEYRPRYEDLDFEERVKQEHLDSLYEDDYDDDEDISDRSKLAILLGVVGVILIIFLIFRTVSLSSQLEDMQNQLSRATEYKSKYEQVQLEKMQVEEELENLKNPNAAAEKKTEDADKKEEKESTSAASGEYKEYTVQSGDTAWTIAQKQLGNGAEYQKILDANGLKESDSLKIGAKIKIPK